MVLQKHVPPHVAPVAAAGHYRKLERLFQQMQVETLRARKTPKVIEDLLHGSLHSVLKNWSRFLDVEPALDKSAWLNGFRAWVRERFATSTEWSRAGRQYATARDREKRLTRMHPTGIFLFDASGGS